MNLESTDSQTATARRIELSLQLQAQQEDIPAIISTLDSIDSLDAQSPTMIALGAFEKRIRASERYRELGADLDELYDGRPDAADSEPEDALSQAEATVIEINQFGNRIGKYLSTVRGGKVETGHSETHDPVRAIRERLKGDNSLRQTLNVMAHSMKDPDVFDERIEMTDDGLVELLWEVVEEGRDFASSVEQGQSKTVLEAQLVCWQKALKANFPRAAQVLSTVTNWLEGKS